MKRYQIDTTLQLSGSFVNAQTGILADPTTVTLYLQAPDGVVQEFSVPGGVPGTTPVEYVGVGQYAYTFTPAASGNWTFKWQGTGAVVATSRDEVFLVEASALIPG